MTIIKELQDKYNEHYKVTEEMQVNGTDPVYQYFRVFTCLEEGSQPSTAFDGDASERKVEICLNQALLIALDEKNFAAVKTILLRLKIDETRLRHVDADSLYIKAIETNCKELFELFKEKDLIGSHQLSSTHWINPQENIQTACSSLQSLAVNFNNLDMLKFFEEEFDFELSSYGKEEALNGTAVTGSLEMFRWCVETYKIKPNLGKGREFLQNLINNEHIEMLTELLTPEPNSLKLAYGERGLCLMPLVKPEKIEIFKALLPFIDPKWLLPVENIFSYGGEEYNIDFENSWSLGFTQEIIFTKEKEKFDAGKITEEELKEFALKLNSEEFFKKGDIKITSPLHELLDSFPEVFKMSLATGVEIPDFILLHIANKGSVELFEYVIDARPVLAHKPISGSTLLHLVCKQEKHDDEAKEQDGIVDRHDKIKVLYKFGASSNVYDLWGNIPDVMSFSGVPYASYDDDESSLLAAVEETE